MAGPIVEPNYIVVHGTGTTLDGRWFDLALGTRGPPKDAPARARKMKFAPTDEFEVREDGVVAQVWRPES